MKVLLDTHAFLWFIQNDPQLSDLARDTIENGTNDIYLSTASLWEMAIKHSIGKLNLIDMTDSFEAHVNRHLLINEIDVLDISKSHVLGVSMLPLHHRDPFDRLLAIQSLREQIPIISIDSVLDNYGVERIW
jgi:PIN domain nuclease of toxin-antitoxin system